MKRTFFDKLLIKSYIVEYWFRVVSKVCANFYKWYFESDPYFWFWRFIPAKSLFQGWKTSSFLHRQSVKAYLRAKPFFGRIKNRFSLVHSWHGFYTNPFLAMTFWCYIPLVHSLWNLYSNLFFSIPVSNDIFLGKIGRIPVFS